MSNKKGSYSNQNNSTSNYVNSLKKKYEIVYPPEINSKYVKPTNHNLPGSLAPQNRQKLNSAVMNYQNRNDIESDISDIDIVDSDINSKPDCITQECLNYFEQVNRCLSNLMIFKKELDTEFSKDVSVTEMLSKVFREIIPLVTAFEFIMENIKEIKSQNSDFHLYELPLNPIILNLLKVYKPFMNEYAHIAKMIANFNRENESCSKACTRARQQHNIHDNVNIDNCLYTVFNSLFSLELMFDRYRKCFKEYSSHYNKGLEAKMVITNLLNSINTSNDQKKFLDAQHELNRLTGKSDKAHINITFIYKGIVTKYARRDDKPMSRQLVLFSDSLFVTYLPNISGVSRVRHELSVDSMEFSEILDGHCKDLSLMKWGLSIRAKEAVQDFCFDSEETMQIWKEKLLSVIKSEAAPITNSTDCIDWIGTKAPRWQTDTAAGFCNGYNCSKKFNTTIRRHHCRADGLLYCDECCCYKINLLFERSPESRVCQLCFNILSVYKNNEKSLNEAKKQLNHVFEKMNHNGMKNGWLSVRKYSGAKNVFLPEQTYYCAIDLHDAFMSLFEKHEDKFKADGIIFLNMLIITGKEGSSFCKSLSSKQFTIEYAERGRNDVYVFTAKNKEECQNWVDCLRDRKQATINDNV